LIIIKSWLKDTVSNHLPNKPMNSDRDSATLHPGRLSARSAKDKMKKLIIIAGGAALLLIAAVGVLSTANKPVSLNRPDDGSSLGIGFLGCTFLLFFRTAVLPGLRVEFVVT